MDLSPLFQTRKAVPCACGRPGDIDARLLDDGVILDISPHADEALGAGASPVGRSIFDFVRREDRGAVRAAMRAALESEGGAADGARAVFGLLRPRRAPAPCEIAFEALGRRRLRAAIRDRSAELAREREARAAAERRAGGTAPDADRIADLSHEMKTPISAIMGFADAMRAETYGPLGDAKYKEYAEFIHASGAHVLELIGDILEGARLKAGRNALARTLTAPAEIARDCAAMIRGEAESAGLKLIVDIAPGLPDAMIDRRVVRQILINLLSNAVKFTGAGEIELSVAEKCGALDFIVRDTGIGMNKTVIAKLGGRFSDTHKEGVRGAPGSGLGLSLAYKLARAHGGALRIDSELGEGTTARLTLPLRKIAGDAPAAMRAEALDIQSQLDRVNAYRAARASHADAA